jgi:hypothetical protein
MVENNARPFWDGVMDILMTLNMTGRRSLDFHLLVLWRHHGS